MRFRAEGPNHAALPTCREPEGLQPPSAQGNALGSRPHPGHALKGPNCRVSILIEGPGALDLQHQTPPTPRCREALPASPLLYARDLGSTNGPCGIEGRRCRPFRARGFCWVMRYPGRCPGLTTLCTFGARGQANDNDNDNGGYPMTTHSRPDMAQFEARKGSDPALTMPQSSNMV